MKAITGTRTQQLIFLVTDEVAERFEKGELNYDGLWEQMQIVTPDPLVYASTEDADLDALIDTKEVFEHYTNKCGEHSKCVIADIEKAETEGVVWQTTEGNRG